MALEKLIRLLEDFYGSRDWYPPNSYDEVRVEFFKNPKPSELKDVIAASKNKGIRFFVDFQEKEVVVWPCEVVHITVFDKLKIKPSVWANKFFYGEADLSTGKMKITNCDKFKSKKYVTSVVPLVLKNKKWLSKYFTNVEEFVQKNKGKAVFD